LENLALRQQLAVYKRTANRPQLHCRKRLFWVCLSKVWTGWRGALVIVAPDTVLRWQRRRFRLHWTRLSGRPIGGRPPVSPDIRALVIRFNSDALRGDQVEQMVGEAVSPSDALRPSALPVPGGRTARKKVPGQRSPAEASSSSWIAM